MYGLAKRIIPINCSCTHSTPYTNFNTVYGNFLIDMGVLESICPLSVKLFSPVLGTSLGGYFYYVHPTKKTLLKFILVSISEFVN